jgi:hyperosmotically inducible protein
MRIDPGRIGAIIQAISYTRIPRTPASAPSPSQQNSGRAEFPPLKSGEINMIRKLATACFVMGTLAASMAAYAADPDTDRSHPGAYVKDSVITTKVKAKLASEHLGSLGNVRVDTDKNGVVFLSGSVRTQDEANRAVAVAKETEGVKSVNSKLMVKPEK